VEVAQALSPANYRQQLCVEISATGEIP